MDADPPLVGELCDLSDCHNHDFLPTKCPGCSKFFCTAHYFREAHDCQATNRDSPSTVTSELQHVVPCSLEGCSSPCLESYVAKDTGQDSRVPATCSRCSLSFCAQHRFPDTHKCKGAIPSQPTRNEAARALLAKNFPTHDMGKKPTKSRAPGASAKIRTKSKGTGLVALMKMRQSAIPGDPKAGHVEIPDRLHVQVRIDNSDTYKTFWFRKSISTGRAFDLLQQRPEMSSSKSWTLHKEAAESDESVTVISVFDRPVSEEFDDGCRLLLTPID